MRPKELKLEWGWTSYKRTGWARDGVQGKERLYEANLQAVPLSSAPMGWQTLRVRFWTQHPILALRAALQGEKTVAEVLTALRSDA